MSAWLNHRFWQRELGGDPAVLDRVLPGLSGDGRAVSILVVGIMDRWVTAFDLNRQLHARAARHARRSRYRAARG